MDYCIRNSMQKYTDREKQELSDDSHHGFQHHVHSRAYEEPSAAHA